MATPLAAPVAAALIAILAVAAALTISRTLSDGHWALRLGFATFVAPAAATYLAIRRVISTVEWIEQSGAGGRGSVAAGLWEAYQILLFALYAGPILALLIFGIGLARWKEPDEPAVGAPRSSILVIAGGILLVPIGLLRYTTGWIIDVVTPGVQIPLQGIAEKTSMLITLTSAAGLISALLLVLAMLGAPRLVQQAETRREATLLFITTTAALGVACVLSYVWSAQLYRMAMTGSDA